MENRKKNFLSSVSFILILVVLLFTVSKILLPAKASVAGIIDPMAMGIVYEKKQTIDVLFIGDSETYSAFVPLNLWKDYGITSYGCGTAAQKLSKTIGILQKAFANQKPKVVFLETNAIFRKMEAVDALLLKSDLLKQTFVFHNRWKTMIPGNNTSETTVYNNETKGYKFSAAVSPADTKNYMSGTSGKARISSLNRTYVKEITDFCKNNGAKLVMVSTPSTKNWSMLKHNAVKDLAKEYKIEYIDMNLMQEEIPIDWKNDTRDKGDHLNYYGASKVTGYIGKYLSETGLVENHKGDSEYSQWDLLLKKFEKLAV